MPISSNSEWSDAQLIQQAFECSPNGICIIDPEEMKIVNANQTALHSLGYTKEELLSKTPQDIDAIFSNEIMAAAFDSIIKSKEQQATFPTVHRCKDGRTFEVEAHLRCITNNNKTYILVAATTTSVLKKAQKELQFHATLFNSISDAVVATDGNYRIISYNKYAQEIFGWKEEEAVGKYSSEVTTYYYLNATPELVREELFKNGLWKGEIIAHKKSGEAFPATVSVGALKDEEGQLSGTVSVIRDITEVKQLEKKLKDLNEQLEQRVVQKTEELRNVFDRISDGFTAFDADWNYTYINKKAADTFSRDQKELIGKNVWQEFPETVGTSVYEKYQTAMREQRVFRSEEYIDIFNKWFEGVLYPSPEGLSVYFHDITEQKKAERALAESELQYRTIVETVQEGIWQMDENSNTTFVNHFMAALLGYTKEELMGASLFQFMTEEAKQQALELVEKRENGIARQHEITFIKKDGSLVYALFQAIPLLKEGRYAGTLATVLDISERKKAEENIRLKANLLNTIGQAVIATDLQGKVTYWNKAAENMYGWMEAEAISRNIVELTPTHQSKEQAVQIMKALKQGKSWSGEFKAQRKDGTVFPTFVTDSPIYDELGKLSGIIGVSSDITMQKQIEEALLLSQKNYRLLFEENPVPLWMTEAETFAFVDINRAAVAQYGYSKETFVSMNAKDLKVPEEYYYLEVLKQKKEELRRMEEVMRHKKQNGEIIHVKITANLITYNSKEVWLVAGRDVTQQLLYEHNLKQSEQRLSLIFNSTQNAMWLLKVEANDEFRLLVVNEASANFSKMDKEEISGRLLSEVFNIDRYKHIIAKYKASVDSGTVQRFINSEQVNNEERIFDFTVIPIKDEEGKVTQLLGISTDITEQKKRERLLIESEEKYRALFVKSPLPNWIYDSETLKFLEVNLAAIEQYGFSKEEFLCMNLYDIRPKERYGDVISANRKDLPETIDVDVVHKKKNGELVKVHVTAHALRYGNKEARMAIVVDHTEQEKAKDKLIATTQQLRELASHLQNIREEERTTIAREIHDELGQQLTALKMDIAWLNRKWDTENELIRNKIKSAIELADSTINAVRRIAAQLRPSMLDDLGLAEAVAWQSKEFSNRTGIAVQCSSNIPDDKFSPAVTIAVFRIFQEALTNIARHAHATKVTCSLQKKGNVLCLTIIDNGVGFDINEQTKRKTLGLLGMKERAIILNGKYNIESKPGEGTSVSVEIPLEKLININK